MMRFRSRHLACLLLLLASLGAAEGSVAREGGYTVGGHYVAMLLGHDWVQAESQSSAHSGSRKTLAFALPAAALTQVRVVWAVRPPAAQSTLTHAVTGSAV